MAAVPWWTEKPGLSVGLFSFDGVLVGWILIFDFVGLIGFVEAVMVLHLSSRKAPERRGAVGPPPASKQIRPP